MRSLVSLLAFVIMLSACTPVRRITTSVTQVRDTTHIVIHDTLRITQVRDSMVFRAVGRVHEQETTTYDPATGHPMQHLVTRDTEFDIDALVLHLADSLYAARMVNQSGSHQSDDTSSLQEQRGQAAISPLQIFARKASSLLCLCFVVLVVILAIRLYARHGKTRQQ